MRHGKGRRVDDFMGDGELLANELMENRAVLTALGDEVRQHLIVTMLLNAKESGLRVGEIAASANLSRPAVSHHLQILKEIGVVDVRHEGTRNYYFFNRKTLIYDQLMHVLLLAKQYMGQEMTV